MKWGNYNRLLHCVCIYNNYSMIDQALQKLSEINQEIGEKKCNYSQF